LDFLKEDRVVEVLHQRCAGIDVHKKTVVVCVNIGGRSEVRTFGTTTKQLLAMLDWLLEQKVTTVAMESTGVYWKPVWNILEASECQPMLVNAHHIKQVPGRKTDVKDAEWIAQLLRLGLLRASNVPGRGQRELQELVVFRRSLVQERARTVNRAQKVLEGANIKACSVVTDITGKSGMAILEALCKGETDASKMAGLAVGRLVSKREQLEEALEGRMSLHQQFMLKVLLESLKASNQQIDQVDKEIEARLRPFAKEIELLDQIPGIATQGAQDILSIIGADMSRYPSARHLASWLQLCPGNNRSADKQLRGKKRRGAPLGKVIMVQLAWPAIRTKGSYYEALFKRLSARRGSKRAALAVAHSMVIAIYNILSKRVPYAELGGGFHDQINKEKVARNCVRRLHRLGYNVTLSEPPPLDLVS